MKKKYILLIHLIYWFYILNQALFPLYVGKLNDAHLIDIQYWKEVAISLLLNIFSFYAVYAAFPKIMAMKNKLLPAVAAVFVLLSVMAVRLPVDWFFWKAIGNLPEKELNFEWIWVWNHLRLVIITGIYAILIRFMINAFETQKLKDELINQRQAGELALLKSQINPHFLFNTLNNIYSLVYKKSDEAPEAVMKFSSIMRYVLYDTSANSVLLEKEIEYLRSYIELQKLRITRPDFVILDIEGSTAGINIAPMLLIPFVENAFKHGSKNHQPGIIIYLHSDNRTVRFKVTNYLRNNLQTFEREFGGVGLINIRRRLELLYPGKHILEIKEENEQFLVNLLIEL